MNLFESCRDQALNKRLRWMNEPPQWHFDAGGRLHIVPQACSDFFRPPGDTAHDNACLLHTEVTGDFTVTTRTHAELAGFGDAAALTVRAGPAQWAKLCVERSPIGDISMVSVVTNEWSDDANSELLDAAACFMRLTRKGDVFAMHYSLDRVRWRLVRCFPMHVPPTVMVGVHAQAPFVGGCRAEFDFLDLTPKAIGDFRSGE